MTVGELIQIATIIFGFVGFVYTTKDRLDRLEGDIRSLKEVLILLARQDERIKSIEKAIGRECES